MNSEIKLKLEQLAISRSIPFCYSCYQECPTGRCNICGSDDLMRLLPGVACEYGTDWIIKEILQEKLTPVNMDKAFEESVRSTLESETVTIGWMNFDCVTVMKEQDPISWEMAQSEFETFEESEGNIISFDNGRTYYWTSHLEDLVSD